MTAEACTESLISDDPELLRRSEILASNRYRYYVSILGKSNFRMLDIGCDAGVLGSHLIKLGVDYYGINIDSRTTESGRARIGDRIQLADFFDYEAEPFDVAIFHQLLEHITQPQEFAKRLSDACPHGLIHGDVPSPKSLASRYRQMIPHGRYMAIELPFHQFSYESKTVDVLFGRYFRMSIFGANPEHPMWGQANVPSLMDRAYYAVSKLIGMTALLVFVGRALTAQ
jgi:SAM-dependent methyltransferase